MESTASSGIVADPTTSPRPPTISEPAECSSRGSKSEGPKLIHEIDDRKGRPSSYGNGNGTGTGNGNGNGNGYVAQPQNQSMSSGSDQLGFLMSFNANRQHLLTSQLVFYLDGKSPVSDENKMEASSSGGGMNGVKCGRVVQYFIPDDPADLNFLNGEGSLTLVRSIREYAEDGPFANRTFMEPPPSQGNIRLMGPMSQGSPNFYPHPPQQRPMPQSPPLPTAGMPPPSLQGAGHQFFNHFSDAHRSGLMNIRPGRNDQPLRPQGLVQPLPYALKPQKHVTFKHQSPRSRQPSQEQNMPDFTSDWKGGWMNFPSNPQVQVHGPPLPPPPGGLPTPASPIPCPNTAGLAPRHHPEDPYLPPRPFSSTPALATALPLVQNENQQPWGVPSTPNECGSKNIAASRGKAFTYIQEHPSHIAGSAKPEEPSLNNDTTPHNNRLNENSSVEGAAEKESASGQPIGGNIFTEERFFKDLVSGLPDDIQDAVLCEGRDLMDLFGSLD